MISTQIQLTENQARILERMAVEKEVSVAELIHQSIDEMIRHNKDIDSGRPLDGEREERRRRALSIIGAFSNDVDDLPVAYANAALCFHA